MSTRAPRLSCKNIMPKVSTDLLEAHSRSRCPNMGERGMSLTQYSCRMPEFK